MQDALQLAKTWLFDNLPRFIGIRKIPDLLPEWTEQDEIKLNMKGYSQADTFSCGVIAGWCALRFLNSKADFKKFDRDCAPNPESGTSVRKLAAALRKQSVRVSCFPDLNFDVIKTCLLAGFPVLTMIREKHWEQDLHHWVVIYGCGRKPRRIHFVGRTFPPGFSKRKLSWREFKKIWSGQGTGIICSPTGPTQSNKRKPAPRKK